MADTSKIEDKLKAQIDIMTEKLIDLHEHRRQFETFLLKLSPEKLDQNFVEAFKQQLDKYVDALAEMPLDDLCEVSSDLQAEEESPHCPECGEYETYRADVDDFRDHQCRGA